MPAWQPEIINLYSIWKSLPPLPTPSVQPNLSLRRVKIAVKGQLGWHPWMNTCELLLVRQL